MKQNSGRNILSRPLTFLLIMTRKQSNLVNATNQKSKGWMIAQNSNGGVTDVLQPRKPTLNKSPYNPGKTLLSGA